MSAFADTSFLFAFYFPRDASAQAIAKVQTSPLPLRISSLVRFEFQQAVWFEVWRKAYAAARGLEQTQAQTGLAAFDLDIGQGVWEIITPDLPEILVHAERLILQHTPRTGARGFDLLHVATARQLASTEFLTFDVKQRALAESEGLIVPF